MLRELDFFETHGRNWRSRLAITVDLMRELSRHTDPQRLTNIYADRMARIFPTSRRLSLSRRGLAWPNYRITRCSLWKDDINPWREQHRLPQLAGGILAELIYSDEPTVIDDLQVDPDDPAADYLDGQRSLFAIPHYDQGQAVNMVVVTREAANAFARERVPELVWMSNMFGRAVQTLVLSEKLKEAYETVDHEMKTIAEIQRSLLPGNLPKIPGLDVAVHYRPTRRAGGDYYDFFPLADGRWGILIADVSGHGTPAAVLMAITHSLAHTYAGPPSPPGRLLEHLNRHLTARYTRRNGSFVTAFYSVYDPRSRELSYANAGHCLPRILRGSDGNRAQLEGLARLPLGIFEEEEYPAQSIRLEPGDQIALFTDGISDAVDATNTPFDAQRFDEVLAAMPPGAADLQLLILTALDDFTQSKPPTDDRTLVILKCVRNSGA